MSRRLALLVVALLVLSAVLTALAPRRDANDSVERSTRTVAGKDVTAAVHGVLPHDRVVRARVGDDVELSVTARGPDSATLAGFGLTAAASPGAPARFSFRADRAGTFAVVLTLSGRRAGLLVVSGDRRSPGFR